MNIIISKKMPELAATDIKAALSRLNNCNN